MNGQRFKGKVAVVTGGNILYLTSPESAFVIGADLIIDGGTSQSDQPSSVVDASGTAFRLVREGTISWSEIQDCSSAT